MKSDRTQSLTCRSRALGLVPLVAVALCLLLPGRVSADARTEARRHFRRGMDLIVEGQIDAGVAELEQAYQILPHPNVLYNIGRAFAEAGRYEEAQEYFEQYLATDPPDRDEVRAVLAAIEQRIESRDAQAAAARASAGQGTTGPTSDQGAGTAQAGPAVRASAEELQALREAAAQIRSLADVSQSPTLRARAERMFELADELERQMAALQAGAGGSEGGVTAGLDGRSTDGDGGTISAPQGQEAALAIASGAGATYEETVVSSSRYAQSPLDAASATTIITRQDIRMSGITHLGELLRRVPGVQVMNTTGADTNVAIRGFNRLLAARVVMLINGRSTYLDPLGITFWATQPVEVEDIERIEIIRGPASALYGANSFSGVVNIITRDPGETPSSEVSAGVGNDNQLRAHVGTNGRVGDLAYRVHAGYQQYDAWGREFSTERQDLVYPRNIDPSTALRSVSVRADLRYRISDNVRLTFEGGAVHTDNFNFVGNAGFTNLYGSGPSTYAMASLQSNWGNVRAFWNYYDYRVVQADQRVVPLTVNGNTVDVEGELARAFHLGVDHNLHLGFSYRYKQVEWNILNEDQQQNLYAAFFEDTLRFSDRVRFVASLRMDVNPLLENPAWSPRGALIIRPTEGQSVRFVGSSAFRIPSFAEAFLSSVLTTPAASAIGVRGFGAQSSAAALGTPPIRPERIITGEVGYQNQESDFFSVEVAAYYNRVYDLMEFGSTTIPFRLVDNADPNLAGLAGFDRDTNQFIFGAGLLDNSPPTFDVIGSEVALRFFPVDGLDVWANYGFNYTRATGDPTLEKHDIRFPAHIINGGVQYRSRFGLDAAVDFHFNSATRWPEVQSTASGIILINYDIGSYYLVNGRVAYRMLDDRLELGVSAYNLTANRGRQHPFAQQMPTRVMGTVSVRF